MTFRRIDVKFMDMEDEMYRDAVRFALQGLDHFSTDQEVATYIKNEFDSKYGPFWQCVVGRHFGGYFTYKRKHYIYFYVGTVAILLFKSH